MAIGDPLNDATLNGWLLTPASNLVSFIAEEMVIAGLVERAIVTMVGLPTILAAATRQIPADNTKAQANMRALIEQSHVNSGFAEQEQKTGFQRIRSHQAVAAWAAVETSIEHLLVNLIRRLPDAERLILAHTPNAKLKPDRMKASVQGAKSAIQQWERLLFATETMERQIAMLSAFQLNVSLLEGSSRMLSEMAGLRDVILHNAGIFDQRFRERCPWRSEAVGAHVAFDRTSMTRYYDAAHDFALALIRAIIASPYMRSTG